MATSLAFAPDLERAEGIARRIVAAIDAGDACERRPGLAPDEERLDAVGVALDDPFDVAVGAVGDPAGEVALATRRLDGGGAEAHALDAPADAEPHALSARGRHVVRLQLGFGGEPVVEIVPVLVPARLVALVGAPRDLGAAVA